MFGLFRKEDELERLQRRGESREAELAGLREGVKLYPPARKAIELWPPAKPSGGFGGLGRGPTGVDFLTGREAVRTPHIEHWEEEFLLDWAGSGSEEEQTQVMARYVSWLTHNPRLGFTKERAFQRLMSILARSKKREEVV